MGPVKLRWLVLFVLVLFCGLLVWWGRPAGASKPNASPEPGGPSGGETQPPPPKPVSWHVVVDSLELTPAPGLVAKMPAKLLLEGTPTGVPCHYRMNLYAGMNQMTAKEGELKPGESLEIPPGTETVAVQLDGAGKEGKPMRFRGIWRQMPRPSFEVINGVAFILGADGILRRLDLVKNPQGEPEPVPGLENFRFADFGYLENLVSHNGDKVTGLWALCEDDRIVVLRRDRRQPGDPPNAPWQKQDSLEDSQELFLYEAGRPWPSPPGRGWETGPLRVWRLPACADDFLTVASGSARIVGLAFRRQDENSIDPDGKMAALLSDGRVFALDTTAGRQFQPMPLPIDLFVVSLGGSWIRDSKDGGGYSLYQDRPFEFSRTEKAKLTGIVSFDGQRIETSAVAASEVVVRPPSSAGEAFVSCADDLGIVGFDRQQGWRMPQGKVSFDVSLSGLGVRKLLLVPPRHEGSILEPGCFLCLDLQGGVRRLVSDSKALHSLEPLHQSRFPDLVDIAVAKFGPCLSDVEDRLEMPLLWALTSQGRPVCLDPGRRANTGVREALQRQLGPGLGCSGAPDRRDHWLTVDVPGGIRRELPTRVRVQFGNPEVPVSYVLWAFSGLSRTASSTGALKSGDSLELPSAGATAVALELVQGGKRQRVVWTLPPGEDYPRWFSQPSDWYEREGSGRGLWAITGPGQAWRLDAKALRKLVLAGLKLPGDEVTVPLGGVALWQADPGVAKQEDEFQSVRRQKREMLGKLIAPRLFQALSPDSHFLLAQDGAFYSCYQRSGHGGTDVTLLPGWMSESRRPALWGGSALVDDSGQLFSISNCGISGGLLRGMITCFVTVPAQGQEAVCIVGQSISNQFLDLDGNLWSKPSESQNPMEVCKWSKVTIPPTGVADIAWIPYEPNPELTREQNLVMLMQDGSLVARYVVRGKPKYIRIEGTSWKAPK